jgi:asparagine N-glycosylation enzyme membrane subunit Stt3
VSSWWDYGYWITTIGNVTTLADNGTVNTTQIGKIGESFVSNETASIEILKDFDGEYVTVFITFDSNDEDQGYGDEGKWRWMARIAGLDDTKYGNYSLGIDWVDTNEDGRVDESELIENELGTSSVLYKLMHYARDIVLRGSSDIELEHFEEAFFTTPEWYPKSESEYFTAMVCTYKIIY